jgi:FkbM family methyltransferase
MGSKSLIRRLLFNMGYEIRRLHGGSDGTSPDFWTWLRVSGGVRTIIDIGANNGEFAEFLSTFFDAQHTIAIEPLPGCVAQIRQRKRDIRNLTVFECALSDHKGRAVLFENSYGPASSLLSVSKISKDEFPQTAGHQQEVEVAVCRLDDLIDSDTLEKKILIKIDVQGLEDKVIRGGEKIFLLAKFVLIEMSFVQMYDGQPLFEEVHELFVSMGFRFAGFKNQIDSSKTGRPLFAHCLYLNQSQI